MVYSDDVNENVRILYEVYWISYTLLNSRVLITVRTRRRAAGVSEELEERLNSS